MVSKRRSRRRDEAALQRAQRRQVTLADDRGDRERDDDRSSTSRASAVGTSSARVAPNVGLGREHHDRAWPRADRLPRWRHVGHRAAPLAARRVPRENRGATRRIDGVRGAAREQLHQFLGHRAAAEARAARAIEHDQVAALESARDSPPGTPRELNSSVDAFLARQGHQLLVLHGGAAILGFEPARHHGETDRNQHRERDDQPQPARETAAQDGAVGSAAHRVTHRVRLHPCNGLGRPLKSASTLRNAAGGKCAPRHGCGCTVFRRASFWGLRRNRLRGTQLRQLDDVPIGVAVDATAPGAGRAQHGRRQPFPRESRERLRAHR